jgi:dTDP-glucose 4,6-dehydratase
VYDEAKRYAEAMTMAYHKQQGVDTCIARVFNTYGPKMRPNDGRAIPTFVRQALEGAPITVFGDGSQTRDYVYAGDAARATLLAAGRDGGVFNVGTGRETSVLELAELCGRVAGVGPELVHAAARPGELQRSFLDPARAEAGLGFRAEVGLERGLERTWTWLAGEAPPEPK